MTKDVTILGAGTMGIGMAQVCAISGYYTYLFDIQQNALEKAKATIEKNLLKAVEKGKLEQDKLRDVLNRITFSQNIDECKANIFIEAVVEKKDVKIDLFNKLMALYGVEALYASNTSSIPITQIAAALKFPDRFIGIHFFNPAHIMKLVEIIVGAHTSNESLSEAKTFVDTLGKTKAIAKDSPGFIVNRVARHFYVESLLLAEENITDFETIDALIKSCGFKMGPFELMDLIGVDTNYSVTESMFKLFNNIPKFRPSLIQKQKVDAGFHGQKSGKGFYDYEK